MGRRLTAELFGTLMLVATVVGSGIMAAKLSPNNTAVALLGNTLPTGAILIVLITILGPISGAHFNPAVSLLMAQRKDLPRTLLAPYVLSQVAGGIIGTIVAHAMFDLKLLQIAATVRSGHAQWLSEFVATFGLIGTILGCLRHRPDFVPAAVGLYITAAYWFTASTSFANPAVTIARALTDTFAGIAPASVLPFIIAQCGAALLAGAFFGWLFERDNAQ
jgi:glycerol uptake facilitator-like aquaporin